MRSVFGLIVVLIASSVSLAGSPPACALPGDGLTVRDGPTDEVSYCENDPQRGPQWESEWSWFEAYNPCPPPFVLEATCKDRNRERFEALHKALDTLYRKTVCDCYANNVGNPAGLAECLSSALSAYQQEININRTLIQTLLGMCACVTST